MKEMVYKSKSDFEILEQNQYKGFNYFVFSFGSHPTAYVEIPKEHRLFNVDYNCMTEIDCHGGLTYGSSYLKDISELGSDRWFIGWDYAHYGDYSGYLNDMFGRKYTTQEIVTECKRVIEQLIAVESEDTNET